jgi:hypothetical protein
MTRKQAEILALKALNFLAEDGDALVRFLAGSGLEVDDLKENAGSPEMLAAVMDFLLADDALIEAFCNREDVTPTLLHRFRTSLPGGAAEG